MWKYCGYVYTIVVVLFMVWVLCMYFYKVHPLFKENVLDDALMNGFLIAAIIV